MTNHPKRRGELMPSDGSYGWTIYEPDSDSLHNLNETARAIWELCDGVTSPHEMAHAISELTGIGLETALSDVKETLRRLEELNLVRTLD
ncbi:MAG: PqqD family protein [Acidimicrobiia bacterium]|nr:PqqD family protein [Acidimicrobiia bacterium]